MERLNYIRYKGSNDVLIIDLHNGYSIIAIKGFDLDSKKYDVEIRIKDNEVENWDVVEESVIFDTNEKIINSAILKWIGTNLESGFFDKYIQRINYYNLCFERGNEIFEMEYISDNIKEE